MKTRVQGLERSAQLNLAETGESIAVGSGDIREEEFTFKDGTKLLFGRDNQPNHIQNVTLPNGTEIDFEYDEENPNMLLYIHVKNTVVEATINEEDNSVTCCIDEDCVK